MKVVTPRLTVRWYEPADAEALTRAVQRSRETLLPWLPWAKNDYTKPEDGVYNIEWFRRWRDGGPNGGHDAEFQSIPGYVLGVFLNTTGELVGGTGLARMNIRTHSAEIGYWTDATHRGKGYCPEATAGLISWCFTPQREGGWGFRRVHIVAGNLNTASCRVCEKLGLREYMNAREDRVVEGVGLVGTRGWDVLAGEWDIARQRLR
ncbi:MAG: GNAT family N-acetyltransferase [Planctomycetota bacterium]|nr:GNAT family N-acetyltransferase [Planctomycetota bacterium]